MTTLGRSIKFSATDWPLNGLRHAAEAGTNGWYVWSSEKWPTDEDGYEAVHLHHLVASHPNLAPYFGLGPVWRFLIAPGYEDVWNDASLLDIWATLLGTV